MVGIGISIYKNIETRKKQGKKEGKNKVFERQEKSTIVFVC